MNTFLPKNILPLYDKLVIYQLWGEQGGEVENVHGNLSNETTRI